MSSSKAKNQGKSQKIRVRDKALQWRRHQAIGVFRWVLLVLALGWAAKLCAHHIARTQFLPLQAFKVQSRTNPNILWMNAITNELGPKWNKKSRFYCILYGGSYLRQLKRQYSFIRDIDLNYSKLLIRGDAQFDVHFREPRAITREKNKTQCLDEQGVVFSCPQNILVDTLIQAHGYKGKNFQVASSFLPELNGVLREDRVSEIENISDTTGVFKTVLAKRLRFSHQTLARQKDWKNILTQLAAAMKDLKARNEKFSYIDLTLVKEGKIIVEEGLN